MADILDEEERRVLEELRRKLAELRSNGNILDEEERRVLEELRRKLAELRSKGKAKEQEWLLSATLEETLGDMSQSRKILEQAVSMFPAHVGLWLCLAACQEKLTGHPGAGRAVLERARTQNPRSEDIWAASIDFELRLGNRKEAGRVAARAVQRIPESRRLWAEQVMTDPTEEWWCKASYLWRKFGAENPDAHLFAAIGRRFWEKEEIDLARECFDVAVDLDPINGDYWGYYYLFEMQTGNEEQRVNVLNRCVQANPKTGLLWDLIKSENWADSTEDLLTKLAVKLQGRVILNGMLV
ncbi:OLC1v1011078C1 [Oldenlandia corymbosa var. corymbosa]|uniref:OLC1v1011078C1 n=1 Tax=Oldenlandia corymbosa var. corymbosa TaxID=529605 RepID=A0AAV1DT11_OLDCO|nr:OLC1v1011078C1 [Oldenlandia corymbosa var. corymbosa]